MLLLDIGQCLKNSYPVAVDNGVLSICLLICVYTVCVLPVSSNVAGCSVVLSNCLSELLVECCG